MRTAAYNVGVASDRRRRKNVLRHILCSRAMTKRYRGFFELYKSGGFYEKSDAKKSQWIKCVKSDILELNNGVIRLFIRERIQNNYIFTCILKGRDEYSLKGKVSWIIEMCV